MNPRYMLEQFQKAAQAMQQRCAELEAKADDLLTKYIALLERIEALEAKRGPGRPPKDPQ